MNNDEALINETQEFAVPTGFPSASMENGAVFESTQNFDPVMETQAFQHHPDEPSSPDPEERNLEFPETGNFDAYEQMPGNYLNAGPTQAFEISHENDDDHQENNQISATNERGNVSDDSYLSTQPFGTGARNDVGYTNLESNTQRFEQNLESTRCFEQNLESTQPFNQEQLDEEYVEEPDDFIEANEDGPASPDSIDRGVEALVEFDEELAESSIKDLEDEKIEQRPRARRILSDEEDEDGEQERPGPSMIHERDENEIRDDDEKSEVGELIADIFGESDEEGAVPERGSQEEADDAREDQGHVSDGLEDYPGQNDEGDDSEKKDEMPSDFVWDFDLMMQKRKEENSRKRRRRRDYDIINDADDMITELLKQMKHAAKEDIDLNSQKLPATRKRMLLPTIMKELKKSDLQSAFIELGTVGVLADWLSPLPDKSLPALEIRTEILKILHQFPTLDHQILRSSGIGKAVMILFKHPKETKENKERASKLINEWARPIFNLQSDYRSLSKDERTKRDYDHMPMAKRRRLSMDAETAQPKAAAEEKVLGPGDKGFIGRARVPRPSTKDYVVRPKWNIETEFRKGSGKKASNKMDRKIREYKEKTKPKKLSHAIGVSIEGRKMAL